MRKFRIWNDSLIGNSHLFEAETAEDALTIARVQFEQTGHKITGIKAIDITNPDKD